jgi:hypothetical protein
MIRIDDAILEAQADEMAEKEVNNACNCTKKEQIKNTVTLSLEEYVDLYTSTEKYCRLLALICSLAEPATYKDMRLHDEDKILDFINYNEMEVYNMILQRVADQRGEEERGEDL